MSSMGTTSRSCSNSEKAYFTRPTALTPKVWPGLYPQDKVIQEAANAADKLLKLVDGPIGVPYRHFRADTITRLC